MTTVLYKRCIHCGTEFLYVTSGHSLYEVDERFSPHGDYCRSCWGVVVEALSRVPVKWRLVTKSTSSVPRFQDVKLDDVLRWEKEAEERNPKPVFRRVAFPVFDLQNPGNVNNARYVSALDGPHRGELFLVSTWSKSDDYEVTVNIWEEQPSVSDDQTQQ